MKPGGYNIEHHPLVLQEDIPKIGHVLRKRIAHAARSKLRTDPIRFGKPLRLSLKYCRTLRVGDYRIVYNVRGTSVRILSVRHRSKGYSGIEDRLNA